MTNEQLFDLSLTEEQQLTRDVISRFSREEIASFARSADEAGALPPGFLDKTMDLGLNFVPIPEAFGGIGAGRCLVSNVLTIEDLAHGDMSMTIAALAPLAVVNTILEFGSEAQQGRFLPGLVSGNFTAAGLALGEPGLAFVPEKLKTSAILLADGSYQLSGVKSMVAFGPDADQLIVVCQLEGVATAFVLPQNTIGATFSKEDYMGLRPLPLYQLSLDNVILPAVNRLDNFNLPRLLQLSQVASSALAVGTCQAVLDYVVPYVNERVAFGEPISNRQAVAFTVADMATELEALRLLVYRAASLADQDQDFQQAAFLAQRSAIRYGMQIGADGVQLLGGHGFTREHPVELWYRNLRALPLLEGMLIA
jgi:alkylation response protein AidB-like acyl-CoA dehydrogenase